MNLSFAEHGFRWSVAGANADLELFCVSVDPELFDVHLWSYSTISTKIWRLRAKASSSLLSTGHHYVTLAACLADNCRTTYVYLETSENTACLFRFAVITDSQWTLSEVFPLKDDRLIFDNTTGPQLMQFRGALFVCGCSLQDYGDVFRVCRLDVVDGGVRTTQFYQFDLAWQTLTSAIGMRAVVWRDKLVFVDQDQLRLIEFVERSDTSEVECLLEERPLVVRKSGDKAFFMIDCCSSKDLWILHAFGWSRYDESTSTWIDDNDKDEEYANPVQVLDCCKKCTSTESTLFWIDAENSVRTKRVGILSLQHSCVVVISRCFPQLNNFSEKQAKTVGFSPLLFRKYFGQSSNAEDVKTVVALD